MNWNNFAEYYDWEFSQVCTQQQKDISMWKRFAAEFGGPILEICCGSGRITLPLADEGYEITAIDYSENLINILKSKISKSHKITPIMADMRNFEIDKKFPFAFISYASFQQLLTLHDQIECLNTINRHLENGAILAFDITPCLCEGEDSQMETLQYSLNYPPNNTVVNLFSAYKIDRLNCLKHYFDRYEEIDQSGNIKEFKHNISLREITANYMELLLEKCGFELIQMYGGFDGEKLSESSCNAIFVARKVGK